MPITFMVFLLLTVCIQVKNQYPQLTNMETEAKANP